ncbi:OX-2 membrane glycoprotein-like [Trematomus bernacchii]|uniref:OX-2 membrane glycoprotein-like n=1 Tax=Trematomus bernacchii TaxID=40690 RepID=UPI00146D875C|nr:OX-2 membrane glycoprotein-like [Trematomus bernacchii]
MARHAVIFLCAFGLFQKGLSALVETQHTVMAGVGEESCLQCQLMQSKNVLQVTWQKVLPAGDGEENIATYTRKFGRTVNPGFNGRVEFKTAGLQNCSINIMNVTERDEGCYRCLFNTIPEGAFIGITCLQIYELHGPFLHVVDSVVSCSATGRPAPTVTLTLPHNSTSVANSNGTFTVTVTARLHNNSREVVCAAQVLSAPQKEASMTISEVNMSAIKGSKEDSRPDNSGVALALIIVSVVLFCVCVAVAIIAFLCRRRHLKSGSEKDSERTKTPQKSTKDSLETCTPLMMEENELRLRCSSVKKEKPSETSNLKVKKNLFS